MPDIKIHRDLDALPNFQQTVITIGSFDGVHIGHRLILKHLVELATQTNSESVVITFYPHPRKLFGDHPIQLITTLREKADLLQLEGIQHLVVVPFSKEFAAQSPEDYIQDFLVQHFHPRCIVIGYDHRYGKGRQGDVDYMRQFEQQCGFRVEEISKQEIENITISSTKIRNAINNANIRQANQLLGYTFRLTGQVIDGEKLGTQLGFPTANLQVDYPDKLVPPQGIYAVNVVYQQQTYKGMLYIGNRPTIDNATGTTIEVNIFDFDKNIYGEWLTIEFIEFLRHDKKFNNLDELKAQLEMDKIACLKCLSEL